MLFILKPSLLSEWDSIGKLNRCTLCRCKTMLINSICPFIAQFTPNPQPPINQALPLKHLFSTHPLNLSSNMSKPSSSPQGAPFPHHPASGSLCAHTASLHITHKQKINHRIASERKKNTTSHIQACFLAMFSKVFRNSSRWVSQQHYQSASLGTK